MRGVLLQLMLLIWTRGGARSSSFSLLAREAQPRGNAWFEPADAGLVSGFSSCQYPKAASQVAHTFASWHMMNGGDLYELAKILGHSNIRMTERYAKLGKTHIARTGNTARGMWKLMEEEAVGRTVKAV